MNDSEFTHKYMNVMEFMNPWSNAFLNNSLKLIQSIKHNQKQSHDVSFLGSRYIYVTDSKIYKNTFKMLFTIDNDEIENFILKYINYNQYLLVSELANNYMIMSNFDYTISHLPFQQQILNLLSDYIDRQQLIDPYLSHYITGSFISPIIQSWIFENYHLLSSYQINSNHDQQIFVDILSTPNDHSLDNMVNMVYYYNSLIRNLYNIKTHQNLHIILIPTNFSKKLNYFKPNNSVNQIMIDLIQKYMGRDYKYNLSEFTNPISSLNINSGCTSFINEHGDNIVIWRCEEMNKVLIHELIHFYSLEKGNSINIQKLNISENYPHYSKELFTELQTWYVYIIDCLSHTKNINISTITYVLDYERTHSIINTCKILQHYNNNNFVQLSTYTHNYNNRNHMINVSSSVMYYYVFKSILLFFNCDLIENLMFPLSRIYDKQRVNKMISDIINHSLNTSSINRVLQLITSDRLHDTINMM